ncbi:MAG: hypothetical protein KDK65_05030 [Chlamydiia bacterium]|nr:hypothetical protein [Chlamydiia bacterium]
MFTACNTEKSYLKKCFTAPEDTWNHVLAWSTQYTNNFGWSFLEPFFDLADTNQAKEFHLQSLLPHLGAVNIIQPEIAKWKTRMISIFQQLTDKTTALQKIQGQHNIPALLLFSLLNPKQEEIDRLPFNAKSYASLTMSDTQFLASFKQRSQLSADEKLTVYCLRPSLIDQMNWTDDEILSLCQAKNISLVVDVEKLSAFLLQHVATFPKSLHFLSTHQQIRHTLLTTAIHRHSDPSVINFLDPQGVIALIHTLSFTRVKKKRATAYLNHFYRQSLNFIAKNLPESHRQQFITLEQTYQAFTPQSTIEKKLYDTQPHTFKYSYFLGSLKPSKLDNPSAALREHYDVIKTCVGMQQPLHYLYLLKIFDQVDRSS